MNEASGLTENLPPVMETVPPSFTIEPRNVPPSIVSVPVLTIMVSSADASFAVTTPSAPSLVSVMTSLPLFSKNGWSTAAVTVKPARSYVFTPQYRFRTPYLAGVLYAFCAV